MKHYFYQALEETPIIAAIKNMDDLELCCSLEEIRVVFVLFGDICTIRTIVKRLKDAGKIAIVHVDLIVGLSSKEIVVVLLAWICSSPMITSMVPTSPTL